MTERLRGITFDLAEFIRERFEEERPSSMHSIGTVGFEERDGKIIHVFPVCDGQNIYKVTVEAL